MIDQYGQQPHRRASIDGFLTGTGQQPRRSVTNKETSMPTEKTQYQQETSPVIDTRAPYQSSTPQHIDWKSTSVPTLSKKSATAPLAQSDANTKHALSAQSVNSEDVLPKPAPVQQSKETSATVNTAQPTRITGMKGPVQEPKRREPKSKKGKSRAKRGIKILGLLLGLILLFFGFQFYDDIARLTGNRNPLSLLGAFRPTELKNTNGRVNILVAGNSADNEGHNGADLTDSIMVLSMDTKKNTAMMLSIPRDLWVRIPNQGYGKINAAYSYGGMNTLESILEDKLDLTIHYNVLVNYSAFRDLVDAVGGITITIDSPDKRGIYDSSLDWTSRNCCALAKYPNGPVELDGKQALNLARARGEGYGSYGFPGTDFTRTEYQRKMLLAIKEKGVQPNVIANPLKITSLVDAVGSNVRTNLKVSEMQTLFYYGKKIEDSKIDSYNINNLKGEETTMLQNYTTNDGQSALIPAAGLNDYSEIATQIKKLFTAGPLVKENAAVVVLNSTETIGLARTQSTKLKSKGVDVVVQSDYPTPQAGTTIIDNSANKKPNTLAELKKMFSATVVTDESLKANYPNADFIVILGQNVADQADTAAENKGSRP